MAVTLSPTRAPHTSNISALGSRRLSKPMIDSKSRCGQHEIPNPLKDRLHDVLEAGHYRYFAILLDVSLVDINCPDPRGLTPLMHCCYIDKLQMGASMARKLICKGADVGRRDPFGRLALHHATISSQLKILELLLRTHERAFSPIDNFGNTPLHYAVLAADPIGVGLIVDQMKKYQLFGETENIEGRTPLLLACQLGNIELARYLVRESRASPMIRDSTGQNALDWLVVVGSVSPSSDLFSSNHPTTPSGVIRQRRCAQIPAAYWSAMSGHYYPRGMKPLVRVMPPALKRTPNPPRENTTAGDGFGKKEENRPKDGEMSHQQKTELSSGQATACPRPTPSQKRSVSWANHMKATDKTSKEMITWLLAEWQEQANILPPARPTHTASSLNFRATARILDAVVLFHRLSHLVVDQGAQGGTSLVKTGIVGSGDINRKESQRKRSLTFVKKADGGFEASSKLRNLLSFPTKPILKDCFKAPAAKEIMRATSKKALLHKKNDDSNSALLEVAKTKAQAIRFLKP